MVKGGCLDDIRWGIVGEERKHGGKSVRWRRNLWRTNRKKSFKMIDKIEKAKVKEGEVTTLEARVVRSTNDNRRLPRL